MNHIRYDAVVVYKQFVASSFADEITNNIPSYHCEDNNKGFIKLYSDLMYRRPFRRLTHLDRRNITNYLQMHDVDIIHYHYGTDAGVFVKAGASTGLPSLVSFYGYDCSSFPRWYFGLGTRYLHRVFDNVDYCLAMSEDMKSDLISIGCPQDKIILHYYGTDVQQFPVKRTYEQKDEVVFLSVGYLVPQKGHIFTLTALKKALRLTNKKIKLRIVGEGRLEERLKEFTVQNDLSKNVFFVGPLHYLSREFLEEYRRADIFVHPSVVSETNEKEGIPGAIVEAMAAGLPVLSTFHAGIPSVITNNSTGLLVNEWDSDRLAENMCLLARDTESRRRIGRAAQEHALKNLDLRQKEIELESIYDRVIEEHKRKYGTKASSTSL
jgi:colanic acid/amylovoran biosynthesis glycosyltransferase